MNSKPHNNEIEEITVQLKKSEKTDIWGFHLKSSSKKFTDTHEQSIRFTINKVKSEGKAYGLLMPNDELISVNEVIVNSTETLTQALRLISVGLELAIVVRRIKNDVEQIDNCNDHKENIVEPQKDVSDTNDAVFGNVPSLNNGGPEIVDDKHRNTDQIPKSDIDNVELSINKSSKTSKDESVDNSGYTEMTKNDDTDSNKRLYLNPEFTKRKFTATYLRNDVDHRSPSQSIVSEGFDTCTQELIKRPNKKKKFMARTLKFTLTRKKIKSQNRWESTENYKSNSESCINLSNNIGTLSRDRINNMISNESGYLGIIEKLKQRRAREINQVSKSTNEIDILSKSERYVTPSCSTIFEDFDSKLEQHTVIINKNQLNILSSLKFDNVLLVHETYNNLGIQKLDLIKKINDVPVSILAINNCNNWETLCKTGEQLKIDLWRETVVPPNQDKVGMPNNNLIDKNGSICEETTEKTNIQKYLLMNNITTVNKMENKIGHMDKKLPKTSSYDGDQSCGVKPIQSSTFDVCFGNNIQKLIPGDSHDYTINQIENMKKIQSTLIELSSTNNTLGLKLGGGNICGIFVSDVSKYGAAEKAGIKVGYKILYVDSYSFENVTLEEATIKLNESVTSDSIEIKYIDMVDQYKCSSLKDGDNLYLMSLVNIEPNTRKNKKSMLPVSKWDLLRVVSTMYQGKLGAYSCQKLDPLDYKIKAIGYIPHNQPISNVGMNKKPEPILLNSYERVEWGQAKFLRPVIIHANIEGGVLENLLFSNYSYLFQPFPLISYSDLSIYEYIINSNKRLLSVVNNDTLMLLKPYYPCAIHLFLKFTPDCYTYLDRKYDHELTPNDNIDINLLKSNPSLFRRIIHFTKNDITQGTWFERIYKSILLEQNRPILLPIVAMEKYINNITVNDKNNILSSLQVNNMELKERNIIESTEKSQLKISSGGITHEDVGIRINFKKLPEVGENSPFFVQTFKFGNDNNKILGVLIGPLITITNRILVLTVLDPLLLKEYTDIVIFSSKSLLSSSAEWNVCLYINIDQTKFESYKIYLQFDQSYTCKSIAEK